eukprot:9491031-Pyramimonas_sp.AAC.1
MSACPEIRRREKACKTSDVSIFSRAGPRTFRPPPWDRIFIPSRFLTVPRPGEGPEKPKTTKNLGLDFSRRPMSG